MRFSTSSCPPGSPPGSRLPPEGCERTDDRHPPGRLLPFSVRSPQALSATTSTGWRSITAAPVWAARGAWTATTTTKIEVEDDGKTLRLAPWRSDFEIGQPVEAYLPDRDESGEWALVSARDAEEGTLELDRALSLRGEAEMRRLATYKWSRDNAAVTYPIARLEPGSRQVKIGATARGLGDLCSGTWLEVVDDLSVLRPEVPVSGELAEPGPADPDPRAGAAAPGRNRARPPSPAAALGSAP